MSTTELSTATATQVPETRPMDLKLEVAILPVSDAERAKQFYASLGWREDADFVFSEDFRVLQFTPPGSQASIIFGTGVTPAVPGSAGSLLLAVDDIEAARAELIERGVDVSEVFHGMRVQRRRPGPRARPGPGAQVLRLVRVVQRPRRQRVAAAGGHHPAARAGGRAGRRRAGRAPARDGPAPRPLREGRPGRTTGGTGTRPTSSAREQGSTSEQADRRRRPLHGGGARCRGFPMRSRSSRARSAREPALGAPPSGGAHSDGRGRQAAVGQRRAELPARADPELPEHLAQVPLDRARAEEQLGADLGVRVPVGRQPRDLAPPAGSARRASRRCACAPSPRWPAARGGRARRTPPCPMSVSISCAARSCSRASTRRFSRRSHSPYTSMRAGERHADAGAAEPLDRLAVERLGGLPRR